MSWPTFPMSKFSTSIHTISGDEGLGKFHALAYRLFNWANNQLPVRYLDANLGLLEFRPRSLRANWPRLDRGSSPARRLSQLFLLELPWSKIEGELGEIQVVDIGCGSGYYGVRLTEYSHRRLATYTGIDIRQRETWQSLEEQYPNFRLHLLTSDNLLDCLPEGANFFLTSSALEHFREDLLPFLQLRDYISSYGRSVLQVHLLPSSANLSHSPYHGVRQYTPRTVSKLTRLFSGSSHSVLFGLGSKQCNRVHYEFITAPLFRYGLGDLRESQAEIYEEALLSAVEEDMRSPGYPPACYALIILSNWKTELFLPDSARTVGQRYLLNNPGMLWCAPGGAQVEGLCLRFNHAV